MTCPSPPTAVARTTYELPGASAQRVRQLVRSADSTPGTLSPARDRTTTPRRVPSATLTVTPRSGRTSAAPSRGLISSRAAGCGDAAAGGLAVALPARDVARDADAPPTGPDAVSSNTAAASEPSLPASASRRTVNPSRIRSSSTRILRHRPTNSAPAPSHAPLTNPNAGKDTTIHSYQIAISAGRGHRTVTRRRPAGRSPPAASGDHQAGAVGVARTAPARPRAPLPAAEAPRWRPARRTRHRHPDGGQGSRGRCPRQDSNLRPTAPEAVALSPELRGLAGVQRDVRRMVPSGGHLAPCR